jgi:3'(2'), 5'-bisphosphate nucleotidase
MGSLRVVGWAWTAAAAPEWGVHRRCCRGTPLARPRAATSSLGAGQLRVGTEHGWLWDCRGGGGAGDYAREMEVAVRVVQVACTLCQRVQDSLLRPGPDAAGGDGRVHAKLDRSPVTVAGSYYYAVLPSPASTCSNPSSRDSQ